MAMRTSSKIALGFAALVAGTYFAYSLITNAMILNKRFSTLTPGRVNLLGVDAGKGYRIVVQNQIATLMQGAAGDFEAPDKDGGVDGSDVAGRRRIPIKEMLLTLQGDPKALGQFVMAMNDLTESTLPAKRVEWSASDIRKALGGDPLLRGKLEADLGVDLEGSPMPQIRRSAIENGIVLRVPVRVRVPSPQGDSKELTGYIREAYQPRFTSVVWSRYREKPEITSAIIQGTIKEESQALVDDPGLREDVAKSLEARIDPKRLQSFAAAPERVLQSAQIVINDSGIVDASFAEKLSTNGVRFYDLTIDLTDEGRQRLWKYSKQRVGSQLMLVVDGIAIGAPRIEHELAGGEVTISQLPDKRLVQDAVDVMKNANNRGQKHP